MDQTVIGKEIASAAVLGSKIFYCGGRQSDGQDVNSCHSYDLGNEIGGGWQEEPSMVEARSGFGLTAVADGLIATGGYNYNNVQGLPLSSVEVFSFKDGWNLEPRLEMSSTKFGHCSIIMGSWLYTIGGTVGGTTNSYISNSVEAIDTTDQLAAWIRKASMLEKRYTPGCHVGVFEGQKGICVAGGQGDASASYLSSAEFYNPQLDIWQEIASLSTRPGWSLMTMLRAALIVSGGIPGDQTRVEMWNGSNLVELDDQNLEVGRARHTAVSIKARFFSCI